MYSAKELYNHALEQYLSNNFFAYCTGVTKATVGISLNQPTVSYKVKDNNNIYFDLANYIFDIFKNYIDSNIIYINKAQIEKRMNGKLHEKPAGGSRRQGHDQPIPYDQRHLRNREDHGTGKYAGETDL